MDDEKERDVMKESRERKTTDRLKTSDRDGNRRDCAEKESVRLERSSRQRKRPT